MRQPHPLLVSAAAQTADTAPTASPLEGRAVYENGVACHAAGPLHAGTVGLQVKYQGTSQTAVSLERTDLTPAFVKLNVRNDINAMPPFRKAEIFDTELEALATFLSHK